MQSAVQAVLNRVYKKLFLDEEFETLKPTRAHSFRPTRIRQIDATSLTEKEKGLLSGHSVRTARDGYNTMNMAPTRENLLIKYKEIVSGKAGYFPIAALTVGKNELTKLEKSDVTRYNNIKSAIASIDQLIAKIDAYGQGELEDAKFGKPKKEAQGQI